MPKGAQTTRTGCLAAFLSVLCAVGGASLPASAQTLRDTAREAVRTNPRVDVVARNREAVGQELERARGLYLPQLDLRVGGGPERSENSTTRARGGSSSLTRRDAGLFATQRLFDGWEADSEVERQRTRIESAANRIGEAVELVALDAVEAHIEVLRQRALLDLAATNVLAHRAIVEKVQARSVEMTPFGEAEQASARLDTAMATEIETRGALEDAESRYLALVDRLPGQLEPAPYPAAAMQEFGTVDAVIERARRNNRTLQVTQTDIRVSEREVEATESAFYPKVSLEFSASRDRNTGGTRGDDNDASALVVMRWNLYRGGADIAQRRVALGRMSQSIAQHHVAARNAEEEVRRAWILLKAAEARIPVLAAAMEKNIRVRDTYATQFLTRERSLIDVLNAENELFVSSGRLVSAQTARVTAAYRLLAVAAELVRVLDIGDVVDADPSRPPPVPDDPRRVPVR